MHTETQQTWQEYRTRLLAFVRKRVQNSADAEDLVQEVLARAYAGRGSLKDEAKLTPWLFQITRNAITDHYRRREQPEPLGNDVHDVMAAITGADTTLWPDEDPDRVSAELADCLAPFVAQLPDRYREAIQYAEFDGLTQRETAQKLGLSHSGAKSRVQRARAMLEADLLACCHVEFDNLGVVAGFERKGNCTGC